jgi:hypothetical protein
MSMVIRVPFRSIIFLHLEAGHRMEQGGNDCSSSNIYGCPKTDIDEALSYICFVYHRISQIWLLRVTIVVNDLGTVASVASFGAIC